MSETRLDNSCGFSCANHIKTISVEQSAPSEFTVLVVDDNEVNRKILLKILSDKYNVITAVNGKEAIEALNEHFNKISCVLLDLVMPEMDGYEFLEKIKDVKQFKNIPIVVTTGNSDKENEKMLLSLAHGILCLSRMMPTLSA